MRRGVDGGLPTADEDHVVAGFELSHVVADAHARPASENEHDLLARGVRVAQRRAAPGRERLVVHDETGERCGARELVRVGEELARGTDAHRFARWVTGEIAEVDGRDHRRSVGEPVGGLNHGRSARLEKKGRRARPSP